MRANYDAVLHRGMLIVKSLLHDLGSALGPYCTKCILTQWLVFPDPVTYTRENAAVLLATVRLAKAYSNYYSVTGRLLMSVMVHLYMVNM